MSERGDSGSWHVRVAGAGVFVLAVGVASGEVLAGMRGEAVALTLIAVFGTGLLVMMGGEVIDSWARRFRRRSKDDPDG